MVRQVAPHTQWPSGSRVHLAVLGWSPDQLESRHGLEFEEDLDDLDHYWLAALALPDNSQVWLERHQGDPKDTTLVLVDAGADPDWSLTELLHVLKLTRRDLVWISPLIDDDGRSEHGQALAMD